MRSHKDFPAYAIYEDGTVINKNRNTPVKHQENNCGYMRVQLCNNGYQPRLFVHRLVAELYIDNPMSLPQVNHKDGNKKNNHVNNLEWCDSSYNHKHSFSNLGRVPTRVFEKDNGLTKVSNEQVAEMRELAKYCLHKEIASLYGLNAKYVGMIVRGERR